MTVARQRLTDRDLALLHDFGLVTVLTFEVIHRRHFALDTTGKSTRRRLRYLTAQHLLAPVAITAQFSSVKERHLIYRLTPHGADWLAQHSGQPVRHLRTDPKPDTLLHRVLVARTILALNDAARTASLPAPRWLLENDRRPEAPQDVPEPQQYLLAFDFLALPPAENRPAERYAAARYDDPTARLVKARPDAAALLTLGPNRPPTCLLFEVDNGTETHAQLAKKLPGYHALLTRGSFAQPWQSITDEVPTDARLLFLFTSAERLQNFIARLLANPNKLWVWPGGYLPTANDSTRALNFLESFVRFGLLAEVEKSDGGQPIDSLRQPIWFTLKRRETKNRLAMIPATMAG